MAWSTTAPTGVTWTAVGNTGQFGKDNYYYYFTKVWIARGVDDAFYAKYELYCHLYHYGDYPHTAQMHAVMEYDSNSISNSSTYSLAPGFGYDALVKTVYWSGRRGNVNVYCYARKTAAGNAYSSKLTARVPNISTNHYVYYYANNGSSPESSAYHGALYGGSLSLYGCGWGYTGRHFTGWNTARDGSGSWYSAGATYYTNSDLTLYAQWALDTYTISYNANGGSGAPGNQTKTYGVTLQLSGTSPTRANYTFLGWSTSSTATSATYQPNGNFTTNAATTLYAVWKKNNKPIYVNVGGSIKQVEKVYVNIGGSIKECQIYVNVGGSIKELV